MTADWTYHVTTALPDEDYYDLLFRADADVTVALSPIFVWDTFKDAYVPIPDRHVTTLRHKGRQVNWEVMKDRYDVVQNKEVLERAIHLANLEPSWQIFGVGTLDDHRKFFAVVSTGSMVINSTLGHREIIDMFIVVISSHDGSLPICYYPLNSRRSNRSVIHPTCFDLAYTLRKRHTPTKDDMSVASYQAQSLRSDWTEHLRDVIEKFYTHIPLSVVDDVLEEFWPLKNAATARKAEHARGVHNDVHRRFARMLPENGPTRLSAWFAICEYLDFGRDIESAEAAQQSLEIDNHTFRTKQAVFSKLDF